MENAALIKGQKNIETLNSPAGAYFPSKVWEMYTRLHEVFDAE